MPVNRENGEIFTPPTPQPEQPASIPAPRPGAASRPNGLQPIPTGMGMGTARPQPAPRQPQSERPQPAVAEQEDADFFGSFRDHDEDKKSHPVLKTIAWGGAIALVAGLGYAGYDEKAHEGRDVNKVLTTLFGIQTGPTPSAPETPMAVPTTTARPTPTKTAAKTATPTKSPTTAAKKVLPATALACAQALPTDIKIGQLIEPAIDANSNMAEVKQLTLKYHLGSWLILKYPVQSDGKTPNIDAIMDLRKIDKDVPTYMTMDGEGGAINRLPGATVPPGPDKVSVTKPTPAAFQKQLETYDAQQEAAGIDVNLAPVADIQGMSKENTDGRLFRTAADAAKYMPSYIAAAKATGMILTMKHGYDVLPSGNTDVKPVVTTPSYDALLKSGALDSYKLVKGTNNWVMMGHAKTAGYPNKAIDNKQIASLNPAAYDAMRKLAGDPLMITDALNAKAVNTVMPQADAAAEAIVDGADIAMIVPRAGYTTTDTKAALAAIEKTVPPEFIDNAFLKVLGAKGINACTLLAAKDTSYLAPKPAAKTNPAPATTTPSSPKPTGSSTSPAKVAATATSKQTVVVKNKAVATATATK